MRDVHSRRPGDAFAELGRIRFSETDFEGVLTLVAELAKRTIPAAGEVSVTLLGAGGAYTPACTGETALTLDNWQYEYGHGPCLTAAAAAITVTVADMADETRWPQWANRAVDAGVRSSLSIGLPLHESVTGALNVYATEPDAFDEDAVALGQAFGGYAAVAMANAHLYSTKADLAQHMQAAMASRAVIEQAKGIIMAERRCTPEEAFALLTKISQDTNRKVRDIAAALVARTQDTREP
nr:GAF and ANTAR domain-containing protein [uncultured Actinoplanes sp.]